MLDALIVIFAIIGVAYGIQQSTLLARPRSWLMMHSSFFVRLLSCPFCVGFYSGLFVYLLHELPSCYTILDGLLWGFAGSAMCGLFSAIFDFLTFRKEN